MDDVLLNKAATVERCAARVRETLAGDPDLTSLDAQDVVVLNLQRAAQACIDGAMHSVREARLGLPQASRDAFQMLAGAGLLDEALAGALMRMVGLAAPTCRFRNVAVHEYRALNLDVVRAVAAGGLGDVAAFARWMVARA